MAVAWRMPSDSTDPKNYGAPIPGKYLQPWQDKLDNFVPYTEGEKFGLKKHGRLDCG